MPTLEQIKAKQDRDRIDALDAAAVALGAPDAATLLAWLANASPVEGQTNFANPNASGLIAALRTSREPYTGTLW